MSSIDQKIMDDPGELLEFTSHNIYNSISWRKVIAAIMSEGVELAVECGPGLSLTQNGRFYSRDLSFINIRNSFRKTGL